jgi:4-hydroxyproline epimerase
MPLPHTRIIDSHTGGEPTRVVIEGGPDLGTGPIKERLARLRSQHDRWRSALANEPRGNDVIVGAFLLPPERPGSLCGVIYFNNAGYIGMCGHGTIGLVETLAYLGRLPEGGPHTIDTPVGPVQVSRDAAGRVTVDNVAAYRHRKAVAVSLPDGTQVHGDVAYGGNWFFLCSDHGLTVDMAHLAALQTRAVAVRQALGQQGITGAQGAEIDHVELLAPAQQPGVPADKGARAYVLCPGLAYDRSPCGTGTSAKLACLAADGKLAVGEQWHQESVIGSVFTGRYRLPPTTDGLPAGAVLPSITGQAHVTLDATMVVDPRDPYAWGIGTA